MSHLETPKGKPLPEKMTLKIEDSEVLRPGI